MYEFILNSLVFSSIVNYYFNTVFSYLFDYDSIYGLRIINKKNISNDYKNDDYDDYMINYNTLLFIINSNYLLNHLYCKSFRCININQIISFLNNENVIYINKNIKIPFHLIK
jgi:hypothetical protein